MKFQKFISVILHPIVIPTIAVMLYFITTPTMMASNKKLTILSLVFVVTYLIPLLVLVVLKKLKIIKTFNLNTIKERKLPIAIMLVVFYLLGNTLDTLVNLRTLAFLFYATSLSLLILYLLFFIKLKASIHLLSLGVLTGFFMLLSTIYGQSYISIIIVLILLAGLLASSRLYLKAHTKGEVYLGFLIGISSVFGVYFML